MTTDQHDDQRIVQPSPGKAYGDPLDRDGVPPPSEEQEASIVRSIETDRNDDHYLRGAAAERTRLEPELFRLRKERDDARNDAEVRFGEGYATGCDEASDLELARIIHLIETRRDATTDEHEWMVLHRLRADIIRGEQGGDDE